MNRWDFLKHWINAHILVRADNSSGIVDDKKEEPKEEVWTKVVDEDKIIINVTFSEK
jgi:ABC-type bacteriocin/lantibiotic exporter with double-glycine peptidase domain